MGYTKEARSMPFGHVAKAAEDVEGLVVSCGYPEICLFAEHKATLATRGPLEIPLLRRFGGRS